MPRLNLPIYLVFPPEAPSTQVTAKRRLTRVAKLVGPAHQQMEILD